jgi:hypothetical protein
MTMTPPAPLTAHEAQRVRIHYSKGGSHRTLHADGALVGHSPNGRGLNIAFFSERVAFPSIVEHEVADDGTLGPGTDIAARKGVVREIEFDAFMDTTAATAFAELLSRMLEGTSSALAGGEATKEVMFDNGASIKVGRPSEQERIRGDECSAPDTEPYPCPQENDTMAGMPVRVRCPECDGTHWYSRMACRDRSCRLAAFDDIKAQNERAISSLAELRAKVAGLETGRDQWKAKSESLDAQGFKVARERDSYKRSMEESRAYEQRIRDALGSALGDLGIDAEDHGGNAIKRIRDYGLAEHAARVKAEAVASEAAEKYGAAAVKLHDLLDRAEKAEADLALERGRLGTAIDHANVLFDTNSSLVAALSTATRERDAALAAKGPTGISAEEFRMFVLGLSNLNIQPHTERVIWCRADDFLAAREAKAGAKG